MGLLVAACDEDLLGKVIEEREKGLRVYVSPDFYKGELKTPEEVVDVLMKADMANLVGEEVVHLAIASGLIHKEAVLNIRGIPLAYFMRI